MPATAAGTGGVKKDKKQVKTGLKKNSTKAGMIAILNRESLKHVNKIGWSQGPFLDLINAFLKFARSYKKNKLNISK